MIKKKKAQTVLASLVIAVIFFLVTWVVWFTRADVRDYVHRHFPAFYAFIPR